jgi:uncharacterized protein (TIGR02646 family)
VRQINKIDSTFFDHNVKHHKPKNWDETKPFRAELREHILVNEQNHQCAYTELYINSASPNECHIDHFKKRQLFPDLFDDYNNLFVATNNEDFGAKYKDKGLKDKAAYDLLLSPLSVRATYFTYDKATGEMEGNSLEASRTIEVFNLNHPYLVLRRLRIIETVTSYKDQEMSFDLALSATRGFENLIQYIYTVN